MILLSNNFDINLLSIKKKLKYPNNFTFIPIKYNNNNDLVIQTPKLYSKYGINNKYEREFIDISFLNIENDTSIKKFIDILDEIYLKINKKYKANHFIKDKKYIRFKLSSNVIIYDNRKKKLTNINGNTYGNYIIYLHGIWIKDNIISYEWILLQAKIYIPFYLTDYSFIEDIKDIKDIKDNKQTKLRLNPPPPPPPLPKSFTKKYVNNKPKIQSKNQLKKKNNLYIPPTLDDITKILLKFKKNKKI